MSSFYFQMEIGHQNFSNHHFPHDFLRIFWVFPWGFPPSRPPAALRGFESIWKWIVRWFTGKIWWFSIANCEFYKRVSGFQRLWLGICLNPKSQSARRARSQTMSADVDTCRVWGSRLHCFRFFRFSTTLGLLGKTRAGWWFGTWLLFSIIYGIILPID